MIRSEKHQTLFHTDDNISIPLPKQMYQLSCSGVEETSSIHSVSSINLQQGLSPNKSVLMLQSSSQHKLKLNSHSRFFNNFISLYNIYFTIKILIIWNIFSFVYLNSTLCTNSFILLFLSCLYFHISITCYNIV